MPKLFYPTTVRPEEHLYFERERLRNLISSKLGRKELASARELAEELFRAEMEFDLRQKTRNYMKSNRFLLKFMVLLLCILAASVLFMVLNMKPSLCLFIQSCDIVALASAIIFNAHMIGKFEVQLNRLIEAYEITKPFFIEELFDNLRNESSPAGF